jgi:hypothetical protein
LPGKSKLSPIPYLEKKILQMEETLNEEGTLPATEGKTEESTPLIKGEEIITAGKKETKETPEVSVVRNWKEYLGESFLIIFSVVLALGLTEVINNINDERRTKEVLHQLKEELTANKKAEEEQYAYHLQVLNNIDSALHHPQFAKKFINDSGEIDLTNTIAPHGVLRHDLNDVAWQIVKQNNIFSKINLDTYSLLTDIYDNQQRITNSELEIGHVLLSFESRKPENLRTTLILVRDNYRGWAVERAPNLLRLYQQAIDKLAEY